MMTLTPLTTIASVSITNRELQTKPELQLLLYCVRTSIDETTAESIKRLLLEQDIDWTYLLKTARRQKVLPLLYNSLKNTCPDLVPQNILKQLRNYFQHLVVHNTFLTQKLLKLLTVLEKHGISAIPFKGPTLAVSVYGNLGLRQFGDLDILVDHQDIPRVKELLLSQGYELQKDLGWEYHFVDKKSRVCIDLHEGIVPDLFCLPLDFEYLRSHLQPLSVAGKTISTISPEQMLLILCVQLGKDCCHWSVRLAQLCDVAELLRTHSQLDWRRVLAEAEKLGCERMLLLDLCLVRDLLGVTLPQIILNKLQSQPVSQSLAIEVRSQLFRDFEVGPKLSEAKGFWAFFLSYNHRFYFTMRERLHDRVMYCLHWLKNSLFVTVMPNEADWALLSLPRVLAFLYYPIHIIRLLIKHGIQPIFRTDHEPHSL
ncbi:nucleotidyltransferase family protein [Moorena sp. SIO3B2]|uniref:nucleotidyltransferase domain-containing protein n=1 Tax=Moorena sp. SIO3B2 TaxID=2607827 RepID=UPI0013CDD386|nr:nucleotidyltransferase family protein [Moorena sp. SIO3B2]NEP36971.1 nucleotidyltransferase family protein [Moorena sp. SIO3B2]